MQLAFKDGDAKDRRIYIKTTYGEPYVDALRDMGFIWNRDDKVWEALPSIDVINKLGTLIKLPQKLQELKTKLEETQTAIDAERVKDKSEVQEQIRAPIRGKLYAHQQKALQMALKRFEIGVGFGLLLEMGTGKSLTAISIAGVLYQQHKIKRVLIVCPGSVFVSWENDLGKFAAFPYLLALMQGTKEKRLQALKDMTTSKNDALQIAVINYEATFRAGIMDALQEYDADLIICDESQRIKTHNAAQSKAMHKLGDQARYKLILSGTPVQNNAIDIYSQYRFLDPAIFGRSFYAFKAHYVIMGGFQSKQIVGFRDMDNLIKKVHSIAFRVTKEECLDLPDQIFVNREFDLEPEARANYDIFRKESVLELEKGTITANTVLTELLRLQQFTGGFVNDDDGNIKQVSSAKLEALKDILADYLPTGKKAVIFARFTAELKAIKKQLEDAGVKFVFVDGSVKIEDRAILVDQFQHDNETKIFLAQISTAGLGITLTAASLTIFYSSGFNYADYSQCLSRTHRIGQKEKCTYINLVAKNTIDAKVLKALENKEQTAKNIVDNWRVYFD